VADPSYVPLWCKSSFSFLEGASHPDELIEAAHRLGLRAIGIADRDGVYGMVRAHVKGARARHPAHLRRALTLAAPGAELVPSPIGVAAARSRPARHRRGRRRATSR
jgi:error-prone DNA polymerase